jgi:hypothetical protein
MITTSSCDDDIRANNKACVSSDDSVTSHESQPSDLSSITGSSGGTASVSRDNSTSDEGHDENADEEDGVIHFRNKKMTFRCTGNISLLVVIIIITFN